MRDFSSNETPHFPARLLSLFFVVKNRGKRIKTNQQTLEISGIFRFVFIIVYGHINASLQIASGADVKTVSANLGHSTVSTTLNIYAHAFDEARAKASEGVGELLAKQQKKVRHA